MKNILETDDYKIEVPSEYQYCTERFSDKVIVFLDGWLIIKEDRKYLIDRVICKDDEHLIEDWQKLGKKLLKRYKNERRPN